MNSQSTSLSHSRGRPWFPGATGLLLLALTTLAGLPQPMCIYFGQARDGFGLPYTAGAEVILLRGTQEIARQTIRGSLAPGVNFALYAHLDAGRESQTYSPRAVRSGELVSLVVRDPDGQKTIMENRMVPRVGQPGDQILINATAAEDEDDDGLPDPWEWELMAASDGRLTHLDEVRGGDDFDGDGQSNLNEYQAGTFAFLDYDNFFAEQITLAASGRVRVIFWGLPGKVYRAECATTLGEAVWAPCPLAISETAPWQTSAVEGQGDWLSLYLQLTPPESFARLIVE